MNSFKKRAQVAEQRAAEAARGREKLLAARRAANQTIRSAMESRRLPAAMMDLLSRPWSNVLVLIYLRQGPDSADWTEAVQFAEDLAWSGEPKTEVQQRLKLRNMLPALDKTLRKGLTLVAYHESDVKHLIGELGKCYRLLLDPGKGPTGPTGLTGPNLADQPPVSASVAPQPIPLSGDPGHLEGTPDEAGGEFELISRRPSPAAPPAGSVFVGTAVEEGDADEEVVLSSDSGSPDAEYLDDQFLALAKGLKVGTWLEFIDAEGNRERAKLSWISPISSKYLFVNRRGLKVADKTVYALAAEFRRKSAEVLENVPLFDRALDAIVERLKNRGEDEAAPGGSAPAPA